jgi:D-glycero-beta-D-manno-heptose-7-phosphate kinase
MDSDCVLHRLIQAASGFAGKKILVIGDLMLDHYLFGQVSRISPEGPVPVVRVESERHLLGGAGNVAKNIAALGASPFLLSACGDDDPGTVLTRVLDREGIDSFVVRDPGRPTTIKTRIIAQNQQVARVDRESNAMVAGEALAGVKAVLREILPGFGCVIISDYAKGLVTAELMDCLRTEAAALSPRPFIMVDPKPANMRLYAGVDLLTPNVKEAGEMAAAPIAEKGDIIKAGLAIFKKLRCGGLLITLGPQGIALFEGPGNVKRIPTAARKVFDVTGAGDSVIAALAVGLASGLNLLDACALANICAGIVVAQFGAAAATVDEVAAALRGDAMPEVEAWLSMDR